MGDTYIHIFDDDTFVFGSGRNAHAREATEEFSLTFQQIAIFAHSAATEFEPGAGDVVGVILAPIDTAREGIEDFVDSMNLFPPQTTQAPADDAGWIDILPWSFGVSQTWDATTGLDGFSYTREGLVGQTTVTFTAEGIPAGISTAIFFPLVNATSMEPPNSDPDSFLFLKAEDPGGTGESFYEMESVLITSYQVGGSGEYLFEITGVSTDGRHLAVTGQAETLGELLIMREEALWSLDPGDTSLL